MCELAHGRSEVDEVIFLNCSSHYFWSKVPGNLELIDMARPTGRASVICLTLPPQLWNPSPSYPALKWAGGQSELWSSLCVASTLLTEPSLPPNKSIFANCNLMPLLFLSLSYVLLSSVLVYRSLNVRSQGYASKSAEVAWHLKGTREKTHTFITRHVCART